VNSAEPAPLQICRSVFWSRGMLHAQRSPDTRTLARCNQPDRSEGPLLRMGGGASSMTYPAVAPSEASIEPAVDPARMESLRIGEMPCSGSIRSRPRSVPGTYGGRTSAMRIQSSVSARDFTHYSFRRADRLVEGLNVNAPRSRFRDSCPACRHPQAHGPCTGSAKPRAP
jgi:hypothetical protein